MKAWAAFLLKPTMLMGLMLKSKYFFQANLNNETKHIFYVLRGFAFMCASAQVYTLTHTHTHRRSEVQCFKLLLLSTSHNYKDSKIKKFFKKSRNLRNIWSINSSNLLLEEIMLLEEIFF